MVEMVATGIKKSVIQLIEVIEIVEVAQLPS